MLVSDLAGENNIEYKTRKMGIELGAKDMTVSGVVQEIEEGKVYINGLNRLEYLKRNPSLTTGERRL